MKGWPHLADQLALPIGPGAIGQQNHGDRGIQIDPERTAAIAEVPDRMRSKNACRPTSSPTAYPSPAPANCLPDPAVAANRFNSSRSNRCGFVPEFVLSVPRPESRRAKRRRSGTFENSPACPATPFNTHAFSSCTSPWMRRWRKVVSSSVGGIDATHRQAPGKIP